MSAIIAVEAKETFEELKEKGPAAPLNIMQRDEDNIQKFMAELKIREKNQPQSIRTPPSVKVTRDSDTRIPIIFRRGSLPIIDVRRDRDSSGDFFGRPIPATAQVVTDFEDRVRDCGGGKSFLYGPILPPTGGLTEAVLLSAWDNVVGPKAVFVWTPRGSEGTEEPPPSPPSSRSIPPEEKIDDTFIQEAVEYTVAHTLHGELGREDVRKPPSGSRGCRTGNSGGVELYVVPDRGFAICSMPFPVFDNRGDPVPHSLAVVLRYSEIRRYLSLSSLFNLWLRKLGCYLQILLHHKKDYKTSLAELSFTVLEFCKLLGSLVKQGVAATYCLPEEIHVEVEQQIIKNLLGKAVTSHLQTCCCSIVIGDSVTEINYMVRVLSQFLRPQDRALVRLAREKSWPYHPGLLIQGILKGSSGAVDISAEDVLCNPYPTTIVDLSQNKVLQSWLLHEHIKYRKSRFKQEVAALINGSKNYTALTQNIFRRVSDVSPLVHDFVEKIWKLSPDVQRRGSLVSIFLRQLEYHANALIKLSQIQSEKPFNGPAQQLRKTLRKQLDLENDSDFYVILATAERLHPGVYPGLLRDLDE